MSHEKGNAALNFRHSWPKLHEDPLDASAHNSNGDVAVFFNFSRPYSISPALAGALNRPTSPFLVFFLKTTINFARVVDGKVSVSAPISPNCQQHRQDTFRNHGQLVQLVACFHLGAESATIPVCTSMFHSLY